MGGIQEAVTTNKLGVVPTRRRRREELYRRYDLAARVESTRLLS